MNRISARLAAASGAAYVVLVVVGNDVLGGSRKGLDVTDSRAAHAAALARLGAPTFGDWASLFLEGAGLLAFLVFVATLWNVLRLADEESPFPAIAWTPGSRRGSSSSRRSLRRSPSTGASATAGRRRSRPRCST